MGKSRSDHNILPFTLRVSLITFYVITLPEVESVKMEEIPKQFCLKQEGEKKKKKP